MLVVPGNRVVWQAADEVFFLISAAPLKLRALLHVASDDRKWGSGIIQGINRERHSLSVGVHTKKTGYIYGGDRVLPTVFLKPHQIEDSSGRQGAPITKQMNMKFVLSLQTQTPHRIVKVRMREKVGTLSKNTISYGFPSSEPLWGFTGYSVLDPFTNRVLIAETKSVQIL